MVTESTILPEMSPDEVVAQSLVPPPTEPLTLENSGFDYENFQSIDFTPEYYEKIMRLFTAKKGRKRTATGKNGEKVVFTPEKAFAVEAADQFAAMHPGFGTYQEFRDGTSRFAPGVKMSDNEILLALTTMKDRGFMESLGRRFLENLPSAATFAATAKATSEVTKALPKYRPGMFRTGIPQLRPIEGALNILGTAYEGAKAVAPIVTGTVSSFLTMPFGQEATDFIIGEESLATPESYAIMRSGEGAADVLSFSPLILGADKIVNSNLTDYLINSLSKDKKLFGRDFDFSDQMEKSLLKQLKNAKQYTGATSGKMRQRLGVKYEGPPIVNDMFERGVASVLQGKTAPKTLLRLHALEQILKKSAKDQRNNLPLFAFYETLAAAGAAVGVGVMAGSDPTGSSEIFGELVGSVSTPLLVGEASGVLYRKALKPVFDVFRGIKDGGMYGAYDVIKDKALVSKAERGFQEIIKELEKFGSLDEPGALKKLVELLEKNAELNGVQQSSGTASKNPVLLAMEDALRQEFKFLEKSQVDAKLAELKVAQSAVDALYLNKDTSIGEQALRAAGELQEAIFAQFVSSRLANAENNLFEAINQLAKSKRRDVSDISVNGSRVEINEPSALGLVDLDDADSLLLAEKLQNLQIAQKQIARNQQNTLYNQVGDMDIMFFEDGGNVAEVPKFVRMFEEEGILDRSDVSSDLRNLIEFTDKVKSQFVGEELRDATSVLLDDLGNTTKLVKSKVKTQSLPLSVLTKRRQEALNIARDNQKYGAETRRIAGMFAEAIQDDIQKMEDFGADLVDEKKLKALKTANSYSRAFYDVYLRSYLGKSLSKGKQGEFKLAVETLGNILGANADLNAVRIGDIQSAGQFALNNNLDAAEAGVNSVNGVIDRILRIARKKTVDPVTKRIDPKKLEEWMNNNARLEESFPELFSDLRNVQTQKGLLEVAEDFDGAAAQSVRTQVGFTSLLRNSKGEVRSNPTDAVAEALAPGADQFLRLEKLLKAIPEEGKPSTSSVFYVTNDETGLVSTFFNKNEADDYLRKAQELGGTFKLETKNITVNREEAIKGLKSSIFEYLVIGKPSARSDVTLDRANLKKPNVIFHNLFERKFSTVLDGRLSARRGQRSVTLAQYLKNKGILTTKDLETAETALKELAKANLADDVQGLSIDLAEAKPIVDFALSISGSAIGTRTQSLLTGGSSGPGSIIAAGKGAEAMRNIALRIPESQRMLFTAQLLQDPKLLARMLRSYSEDPTNQRGLLNSLANYVRYKGFIVLPSRGITASRDETFREVDEEESQVIPSVPATNQRASLIPRTETPTIRPTVDPRRAAAPAPIVPNNVSQPATQSRYAALFPNDTISSMIKNKEGIGSLI